MAARPCCRVDRFARACAGRVDVRVRAAGPRHGEHRGRARVLPRARRERPSPGKWITLSQVFITRLREQRYPTRAELDEVAPRHPVAFRTGPDASLNSMALSRAASMRSSRCRRASRAASSGTGSGEPTGILRNCGRYIQVRIPAARSRREADRLAPAARTARRLQLGRLHEHRRCQCGSGRPRAVSHTALAERADVPHVHGLRRGCAGAARQGRSGDPRGRGESAAPAQRHAVAARHQGVSRWRHADRQRLHARAVGGQQDLFDRRSRVPRRPVHRAREAVSDGQARAGKRPAVHRAFARRCGGRGDGRGLRTHQPRRLSGPRPAPQHHARQLHDARRQSRR